MNYKEEIARVENAIAKAKSPYFKKDYEKYLKKLYKKARSEQYGREKRT